MIDFLAPGLVYSLIKDGFGVLLRRRRRLRPSETLELRQKWKPLFEAEVRKTYREKLRRDVIIRDMKRIDAYPELDETRGISPWFRVGLVGTYHRGILIGLGWEALTRSSGENQWRFTRHSSGEDGDIKVFLVGRIPYENIDNVDWAGDEYYRYPHIYCYFFNKREPYEHLGFYTETTSSDMQPFYTEVASYDQVRRLSKRLGVKRYS